MATQLLTGAATNPTPAPTQAPSPAPTSPTSSTLTAPKSSSSPQSSVTPPGLDSTVLNLAKAIRQQESGGNYNAKGADGEMGAYQFTPATWSSVAPKYGITTPLDKATPEEQNAAAYNYILDLKNQGYNPVQVASVWNSGHPDPTQAGQGTSKGGAAYNTPAYATDVYNYYNQFKQQELDAAGVAPPPSVGGFLGNVVKSGANFLGNTADALLHPINTIQNIGGAAVGGLQELGGQSNDNTAKFDSLVGYFKNRYNSPDAILHTAYSDPVGFAGDIAAVLGGGAGVAGAVGKVGELSAGADAARAASLAAETGLRTMPGDIASGNAVTRTANTVGSALSTASKYANPLTPVISGVGAIASRSGKISSEIGSQVIGLEPDTIREIVNNPSKFTPEEIANTSRVTVAKEVETALQSRISALEEEGAGYNSIRESPSMINIGTQKGGQAANLQQMIEKNTGLKMNEFGAFEPEALSKVDSPTDVAKINRFYHTWAPYFEQGQMTAKEFLTMRTKLAKIANFEGIGKSSALEDAAAGIRADLNTNFRDQIPGLTVKDATYSEQANSLEELRKGFIDKEGNLTDAAISKIANAGNKYEALARLEEILPGISNKLKVLKAMQDIERTAGNKVGTYTSATLKAGSILAGISTGSLPIMAASAAMMIITSPEIAVPLLKAFGANKQFTSLVMGHLAKYATIGAVGNKATANTQPQMPLEAPTPPQSDLAVAQ